MTLSIGDHLVIKRNGKIVDPKDEAYHEYEVKAGLNASSQEISYVAYLEAPDSPHPPKQACTVKLLVVD